MSDRINNGGAAFPHQFQDAMGHPEWRQSTGMTLRDYFAGQAPDMPGWWMSGDCPTPPPGWKEGDGPTAWDNAVQRWMTARVASWRYSFADAMIAARGGEQ